MKPKEKTKLLLTLILVDNKSPGLMVIETTTTSMMWKTHHQRVAVVTGNYGSKAVIQCQFLPITRAGRK